MIIGLLNRYLYKIYILIYCLSLGIFFLIIIRFLGLFFIIRVKQLRSPIIGHFAANTELYLCEKDKNINFPSKKYLDLFYLAPLQTISNEQLLKMWKRKINILPWQLLRGIDLLNNAIPGGSKHNIENISGHGYDTKNLLDKTKVHLTFTKEEDEKGKKFLKKIGLKKNDNFVCLIVRDELYNKKFKEKNLGDFNYHNYRNCEINNFLKTCNYLNKKCFYIFRMGKIVKKKFKINNKKVIDYASNGMQSDFLDIYLGAKCSFWISTGTGLDALASVFRKPVVFTNEIPIKFIRTTKSNSIFIIKYIKYLSNNRKLSLKEISENKLDAALKEEQFIKKKTKVCENTQIDILDATKDFYKIYFKKKKLNKKDKILQENFWKKFPYEQNLHGEIKSIISPSFLRKNKYLLK